MANNQNIQTKETYELLLDNPFLSLYYNSKDNWIYSEWHGDQTTETMIDGTEKLLNFARLKKANKILNNSTQLTYAYEELIDWIANDYAPRLQAAGVEYFAWIYSDENLSRNSADKVLKMQTSDIIVVVFDNVATAEKWLRSLK